MSFRLPALLSAILALACPTAYGSGGGEPPAFLKAVEAFPALEEAAGKVSTLDRISFRAAEEPFLVVASLIFLCAIIHTFFAVPLTRLAHRVQHRHDARIRRDKRRRGESAYAVDMVSFKATILHFLGEIEAIFGIWVLALVVAMIGFYDVGAVRSYIGGTVDYTEAMFVVVIMALASTRPVLNFAEECLSFAARIGRGSPAAWWLAILTVAPILGSFITEPGAMTIAAMLLAKKFYHLRPSPRFAYATLGLLFVNISIGGVLTNFAAPPVLMVAGPDKWDLTTAEMFVHFGEKSIAAILISTSLYFLIFRKELAKLGEDADESLAETAPRHHPVPAWVTVCHLGFMGWTVAFAHEPPLFIGGFLFFLAFRQATAHYQHKLDLRGPILVGFFLAGLVVHGGLQGWWLSPIITSLGEWPLFGGSVLLTSFNDNAAITFLASQVDGLDPGLKYAVLAGAVSGGGLTVIANAPNPAGQALLSRFFGDGVSPAKLLAAALVPTLIVSAVMMLVPDPHVEEIFRIDPPPGAESTPHEPH